MLEYYSGDGQLRLYVTGEIDHHTCAGLRQAADDLIERIKPSEVRIDLRDVTFCDSSGIAFVLGRYKLLQSMGSRLTVENIPPQTEKVFRLAAVDRLVPCVAMK